MNKLFVTFFCLLACILLAFAKPIDEQPAKSDSVQISSEPQPMPVSENLINFKSLNDDLKSANLNRERRSPIFFSTILCGRLKNCQ